MRSVCVVIIVVPESVVVVIVVAAAAAARCLMGRSCDVKPACEVQVRAIDGDDVS